MIRQATAADAEAVIRVYNHYVLNSWATFEEEPVTAAEMARRIDSVARRSLPWLAVEEGGRLIGYACASPWKDRSAYRFSAETSVYLEPERRGRGWGARLLGTLVEDLRAKSIHSAVGIIALPNEASVALHEKLGFRKVAHLAEVGWKFGRRVDVGYWQLLL
jgi:L-amino acid N-acyltransferase YncA